MVAMLTRPRPIVTDALLAGVLCALDVAVSADFSRSSGVVGGAATPFYAAAGYVLLVWRRRYPGWVLAGMVVHSILAWKLSHGYVPTLGVWLALYTLAARRDRRTALIGLVAALLPAALNVADVVDKQSPGNKTSGLMVSIVALTMFNLAIFGIGRWSAWTVQQQRLVAERAAADAAAKERGRIARDLHDIVAHAVTIMLLQAGGAARLLRTDPARAEAALSQVDDLGQQAIGELRRMLGLLAADADEEPDTPKSLADITRIVARIHHDGLQVALTVAGDPAKLDAGVDVSAYRIVQEALTNATRYADHRHPVRVNVRWHEDSVDITVSNHVRSAPSMNRFTTGRGLIGMRERANATGGTFEVSPHTDGRFTVAVTLPASALPGAHDRG
jgi:signal transduction histidine kinase